MKRAETLLPGTDALPSNTAEMTTYRGRYLVRVRDANGSTQQRKFPHNEAGRDEAFAWMMEQCKELQIRYRNLIGI